MVPKQKPDVGQANSQFQTLKHISSARSVESVRNSCASSIGSLTSIEDSKLVFGRNAIWERKKTGRQSIASAKFSKVVSEKNTIWESKTKGGQEAFNFFKEFLSQNVDRKHEDGFESLCKEKSTQAVYESDDKKAPSRVMRALVIDDSNVVRKTVGFVLKKMGYKVNQASDGMEGLEKLKQCVFDVTLCDFLMPCMDGLDCVRQYREWESVHRPSVRQFIIGMSAHANERDVSRGLKEGMNDFKPKPITGKVLKTIHESPELESVRLALEVYHELKSKPNYSIPLSKKGNTA